MKHASAGETQADGALPGGGRIRRVRPPDDGRHPPADSRRPARRDAASPGIEPTSRARQDGTAARAPDDAAALVLRRGRRAAADHRRALAGGSSPHDRRGRRPHVLDERDGGSPRPARGGDHRDDREGSRQRARGRDARSTHRLDAERARRGGAADGRVDELRHDRRVVAVPEDRDGRRARDRRRSSTGASAGGSTARGATSSPSTTRRARRGSGSSSCTAR